MTNPSTPLTGLRNVSSVILRVSDIAGAVAFYTQKLGLRVTRQSPGFAFLDAGAISLILNKPEGRIEPSDAPGLAGYTEVVFDVADIRAAFAALRGRGVQFLSPEPFRVSGDETHDVLAAPFRDPDGHLLSITGKEPKQR